MRTGNGHSAHLSLAKRGFFLMGLELLRGPVAGSPPELVTDTVSRSFCSEFQEGKIEPFDLQLAVSTTQILLSTAVGLLWMSRRYTTKHQRNIRVTE
jgi:hypothetical protein